MRKVLALLLCVLVSKSVFCQKLSPTSEANFLYNFTRYIEWEQKEGIFSIVILGSEEVYNALSDYAKFKKIGNRPIRVVKAETSADVFKCDILFIAKPRLEALTVLNEKFTGKNVLIVTEESNNENGSCINFINEGGKLKFELNKSKIIKQGLKMSSDLEKIAVVKN